jgi:hypothetical protein
MEQLKMNVQELLNIARTLIAGDKGLLAMDESNPTCNKTLCQVGDSPPARLLECTTRLHAAANTMPRWIGHENDNEFSTTHETCAA